VLDDQDDVIGEYWYDGDGRRVRKHVPSTGEVTVFVYDASGKLIAEYSTIVETTNAKVGYVTNDHLASPRINTDENGAVTSRHDYHPFGEEIAASERTTGLGYVEDTVRKQFTGYERDDETELDFAKARYFASSHGRFSSPDDFLNDTDNIDPQSWNLYVYVRNNPLRYVDPDGKIKRDKDGNIIKEDREDKDEYTTVINGKTYYLSPYKSADGKKQVVWEVKKVTIFADNGDKIKAYETKGDLQVLQTSTDANGQATSNLLSVDDSKAMLGPDSASYDNKTNCHGTTFADGKVWIENDQVGAILKGDGYSQRRSGERADEGDVGLYTSTENGKSYVDHTVRVDFVDDKSGAVIDVTSKGGITPKQTRAAPGPGPGTAWPNSTSQVHYFTQRMKK
jgi:RHS repeat-associated protein